MLLHAGELRGTPVDGVRDVFSGTVADLRHGQCTHVRVRMRIPVRHGERTGEVNYPVGEVAVDRLLHIDAVDGDADLPSIAERPADRSEERRVGKERRSRTARERELAR